MPSTFGTVTVTFKGKKKVECPATYTKESSGNEYLDLTCRQITSIDWKKYAETLSFKGNTSSSKAKSWVPGDVGFWLGPEWVGPRIIIARESGNALSIFP
jgi:hypothetical protein